MTKKNMKTTALELLTEHKANKKLTAALTDLFEEYTRTGKLDSVKREKHITVKGISYQWCNRHEVYEPLENFKNDKSPECKLATKFWNYLGTEVKTLQAELNKFIDTEEFNKLKGAKTKLDEKKAQRGGRYDFEANHLQFPDIENYFYSQDNFIQDGDVA